MKNRSNRDIYLLPCFMTCTYTGVEYRGEFLENPPVNLTLCTTLIKTKVKWYPDNKGIPAIKFKGCDTTWVFVTEERRDREIKRIIENQKEWLCVE